MFCGRSRTYYFTDSNEIKKIVVLGREVSRSSHPARASQFSLRRRNFMFEAEELTNASLVFFVINFR